MQEVIGPWFSLIPLVNLVALGLVMRHLWTTSNQPMPPTVKTAVCLVTGEVKCLLLASAWTELLCEACQARVRASVQQVQTRPADA
jgi:hypothetical protein